MTDALVQATTKKDRPGGTVPRWMREQRLTVDQALRLLTTAGAYGIFAEDDLGMLAPGMLADFVVLSEDPHDVPRLALEPQTYFIDPDGDRSTPLRVVYEVPAEGWSQWIGAVNFADDGHVGVSITTVTNLVRHGCRDHSWADPPVGPSVDDLATALADLAPFRVTSPPRDVASTATAASTWS